MYINVNVITYPLVQRLMHIKKNDSMASFMLPEDCENFATIYDDLQGKLEQVSVTDELLAGMIIDNDLFMPG